MTHAIRAFLAAGAISIALVPSAWAQVPAAQWAAVGPPGAAFRYLAIAPTVPSTVYGAGAESGLYKSTDGGANWTRIETGLPNRHVHALGVAATSAQLVFVAVDGGLYRSANGGTSWEPANEGLDDSAIQVIANHPTNGAILYAGARNGGVFRSVDAGATWSAVVTGLTHLNVRALAFDPFVPDTLYAGTPAGVFRTANGGTTWTLSSTGLADLDVRSLAVARSDSDTLYAGTLTGVFRSLDAGAHWAPAQGNLPPGTVLDLIVDALNPNRVVAVAHALYLTVDGGATWSLNFAGSQLAGPLYAVDNVASLANRFVVAGASGVLRSDDNGAHFFVGNGGLAAAAVTAVGAAANGETLYAALESSGLWLSTTGGGTAWTHVTNGLQPEPLTDFVVDPGAESTVYAGSAGAGLFKSVDAGLHWSTIGPGNHDLQRVALAEGPRTLYLAAPNGVLDSVDEGSNWTTNTSGLTDSRVAHLAIDPAVTSRVYAATPGGLFLSTDAGGTWSSTSTSLGTLDALAVALDPVNPLNVVLGTAAGTVFRSPDGGVTWSAAATGLPGSPVVDLLVDPASPAVVFAATATGVYRSSDGGASFAAFATAWPANLAVRQLTVDPAGRYLVAATASGGVYRYPLWVMFADGFESGTVAAWSAATP